MSDAEIVPADSKPKDLASLVEDYGDKFGAILPAHIGQDRYVRWSTGLLRKAIHGPQADKWQHILTSGAGQASVMQALMDCASLGLEPGREYHLVPYGNEVTGIVDYKGEIRLITNARRCSVVAQLVRKADTFMMVGANVPPRHDADWFAEPGARGELVGGYAYVSYPDYEYSMVSLMTESDFEQRKSKARTRNVWEEWPEQMRLKTLVHQLRKWVPWSPEFRP